METLGILLLHHHVCQGVRLWSLLKNLPVKAKSRMYYQFYDDTGTIDTIQFNIPVLQYCNVLHVRAKSYYFTITSSPSADIYI